MFTFSSDLQPQNAKLSILLTVDGSVTSTSDVHSRKAMSPTDVIAGGIAICLN